MTKRITKTKVTRIEEPNRETEIKETVILGSPSDDKDFLKIYPMFIEVMQKDLKIKNGRLRLFLWFVSQIRNIKPNSEPLVVASQNEMAKALNVDLRTIKNYIRELLKKEYILRYKGIKSAYLVNPSLIYKGSVSNYFHFNIPNKPNETEVNKESKD